MDRPTAGSVKRLAFIRPAEDAAILFVGGDAGVADQQRVHGVLLASCRQHDAEATLSAHAA
jgi:hypothetical protein